MTTTPDTDTPLAPADLGLDCAVHDPTLDHFPWQLALTDGRVVLLSADLVKYAVLPSGGDIREPNNRHEMPLSLVPPAVLAAAGKALNWADFGELRAILRRRREIAQFWGVYDVLTVRPDLSDDQAWAVLRRIEDTMDAEVGITWRVLGDTAFDLFGPAPDEAAGD